ncbi:hypothetical protein GXW74_00310 [Roseomonas eburnea]|uniref:HD domain-containing protein n=1 Tax=Neoroseomonas eburnea TaxID=1346889 RepID=A0A9X9X5D1_9PROT|nr:hypothetical protein [Neoroseomonas eburnea]MBR0678917.1 hypothetical protein [Neoroseomonas eburnea]
MAAPAETSNDVLDRAFREPAPLAALTAAEQVLIARRAGPPRMRAAVAEALAEATGRPPAPSPLTRAAFAIADAVERHGAAFAPGTEPAYHDRHHQAEAAIAMGWLAGAARRLGLIDTEEAELAVAAMAAHDLLHDGRVYTERGALERRSAEVAAAIAAQHGVPPEAIAELRRIILATTWPWAEEEAPDLLCRLAREADLFGSSLPNLGLRLSRLLALELEAAGQPAAETVAGHVARLALLRLMPPPSPPAQALGLGAARAAQIATYREAAARLGLAPATPEAGAAALDTMDPADAEALLAWAGAAP